MNDFFLKLKLNNNKELKIILNKYTDNFIDVFNKIQEFKSTFNHITSFDINLCDENEYMKIINNNFPKEIKNKINSVQVSEINKESVKLNEINIETNNKIYTCAMKDSLYTDKDLSMIKVRIKNVIQTFGDLNVDRINEVLKNTGAKLVKYTKLNNFKTFENYKYDRI